MDLEQLKQILNLVRDNGLTEFEIEHEGLRLRVRTDGGRAGAAPIVQPASVSGGEHPMGGPVPAIAAFGATEAAAAADPSEAGDNGIELAVVKSPIVGTFYRSPEPGAPTFVEVGSTVKRGQVVCIIEAMKLMNEIDSEYDGEVVNIYVENGQPVQYGERLFAIRTR